MGLKGLILCTALLYFWGSLGNAAPGALGIYEAPFDASTSTYPDVRNFLHELVKAHPNNARIIQLGTSDSGDVIEGLAAGDGPTHNLVVATHHGNEYGSAEVGKAVAASVAANPIAGQTVFVIPVLNIPGYNKKSRWESAKGSSHDPNRDYPGPCGGEGPHNLKSTALLAKFVDEQNIVASATLHTFYPAVVYPWGFDTRDLSTPYDDQFKELSRLATIESGYQIGNSTEVIYAANGTYEDYAYWKHGVWSILFELGQSHSPSQDAIAEMVRVNVPGIRRMLEQAPQKRADDHGFKGVCNSYGIAAGDRHDE